MRAVGIPQGQCSQGCHRRCAWCRPQTCPPCTSRSQLSLCGPRCQAAHYPALDPWERRRLIVQVWVTLIDNICRNQSLASKDMINLCHVCVLHCRAVIVPNQAMLAEQAHFSTCRWCLCCAGRRGRLLSLLHKTWREREVGGVHYLSENWPRFSASREGMELKRVMKGRVTK